MSVYDLPSDLVDPYQTDWTQVSDATVIDAARTGFQLAVDELARRNKEYEARGVTENE